MLGHLVYIRQLGTVNNTIELVDPPGKPVE
mgnify:CR=1 FL=1